MSFSFIYKYLYIVKTNQQIKQKLREALDTETQDTVVNGILNKVATHIYDAYRELENACQYIDDLQLRKEIEDIKLSLGHDLENSGSIADSHPTIISRIMKVLGDRKPEANKYGDEIGHPS
jgi:hypothetical protein